MPPLLSLRQEDERGEDRADIIDPLTLQARERRRVVGLVTEMSVSERDGEGLQKKESGRFTTNPQHGAHLNRPTLLP